MARATRHSTTDSELRDRNRWFLFMLVFLALLYWLFFARSLERIDLSPVIDPWWQTMMPLFDLPGIVVGFIELLHPRVLRHLVVIIVGWLLAEGAAISLVHTLYDLPDRDSARLFLGRLRSARGAIGGSVKLSRKTLDSDREESVLLRVGGPGLVSVPATEVAVTETNGRFQRVLGPGSHLLGRFENIYAVLDLRLQERVIKEARLSTKDGIEIKTDVTIAYRISTGGEPVTRAKPFPYDQDAVRLAAYAETVHADGTVSNWEMIPISAAKTRLGRIIAKYELDQLLYPRSSVVDPNLTIRNELERHLRVSLQDFGIELVALQLGRLELPQEVFDQYIEYWQAHWETQSQLAQVDGEAFTLEEVEVARAEAEVTMIRAIVEGLQRARLEGSVGAMNEIVALRLIEALERVAEQSQDAHPLPTGLLPELSALREQLMLESG